MRSSQTVGLACQMAKSRSASRPSKLRPQTAESGSPSPGSRKLTSGSGYQWRKYQLGWAFASSRPARSMAAIRYARPAAPAHPAAPVQYAQDQRSRRRPGTPASACRRPISGPSGPESRVNTSANPPPCTRQAFQRSKLQRCLRLEAELLRGAARVAGPVVALRFSNLLARDDPRLPGQPRPNLREAAHGVRQRRRNP